MLLFYLVLFTSLLQTEPCLLTFFQCLISYCLTCKQIQNSIRMSKLNSAFIDLFFSRCVNASYFLLSEATFNLTVNNWYHSHFLFIFVIFCSGIFLLTVNLDSCHQLLIQASVLKIKALQLLWERSMLDTNSKINPMLAHTILVILTTNSILKRR